MERTYTLQDLVAALKRRRALALLVGAAVGLVGVVAALGFPAEYTAASVVQIEPRRLPADFLPAANGAAFEERMRTIKHGVLARPVLERVIRDADLYPDVRNDMDEAVSRLRRAVEVRLEGEVAGGPPALLFVVEVRGKDPRKVVAAGPGAFKSAVSYGERTVEFTGEKSARYVFKRDFMPHAFHRGVILAALAATDAKNAKVSAREPEFMGSTYEISWE